MLKLCFQYALTHFSISVYTQREAQDKKIQNRQYTAICLVPVSEGVWCMLFIQEN